MLCPLPVRGPVRRDGLAGCRTRVAERVAVTKPTSEQWDQRIVRGRAFGLAVADTAARQLTDVWADVSKAGTGPPKRGPVDAEAPPCDLSTASRGGASAERY